MGRHMDHRSSFGFDHISLVERDVQSGVGVAVFDDP